ncbi:MAG TPA: polysaccharide biosynthesis/export family protein [Woeseiaceae bacterium]|nr:polysaccharide biosynthesis/export family protein [Woeseiaceae bacterium]
MAVPRTERSDRRPGSRTPKKTSIWLLSFAVACALNLGAAAADGVEDGVALARGDVIKVIVYGRPELTGTYPVGTDGSIRVPLVGTVAVAGLSMAAAESELKRRVSGLLDYAASVTVDMAHYRPVFVMGAVTAPGEFEYTPGLSVMQAVARAGGLASGTGAEATTMDALRARKALLAALLEVQMLSVRRAALSQSLDGVDTLSLPDHLDGAGNTPLLRSMLREQQDLLDAARKRLRDSQSFIERQKQQIDNEIRALLAQQKTLSAQANVVARELGATQSLRDKGLTTSLRLLSQQQMESDLMVALQRASASLSRAQLDKVELEQRLQDQENAWRQDLLTQKAKTSADLAQARTGLEAAQQQALALGSVLIKGSLQEVSVNNMRFIIGRLGKQGFQDIPADANAPLQPGDILRVELPWPRQDQVATGGN